MTPDQRIDANIDAFLKSTGADPQRIRIQYGEAKVEKMRNAMRKMPRLAGRFLRGIISALAVAVRLILFRPNTSSRKPAPCCNPRERRNEPADDQ